MKRWCARNDGDDADGKWRGFNQHSISYIFYIKFKIYVTYKWIQLRKHQLLARSKISIVRLILVQSFMKDG
jgi:hypothetical protein